MKKLSLRHFFMLTLVSSSFGFAALGCEPAETKTPPPAEDKYTLENVCTKTPELTCTLREGCCTQAMSGYVESGCLADVTTECEKNVADVKAGIMTFDGDSIDACSAGLQPFADICFLEIEDLKQLPAGLAPCAKVFVGQLKDGETCERTAQCQSSLSDREFVQCDDATKKCKTTKFLPIDSPCKISQTVSEFCDDGLYCDFDLLSMKGTCKTATPLGSACNPGTLSLECGLGFKCDAMTSVCVEAGDEGAACVTALDCKSANCASQLCVKANPVFNKTECTGMP